MIGRVPRLQRRVLVATAATTLAIALSACGSSSAGGPAANASPGASSAGAASAEPVTTTANPPVAAPAQPSPAPALAFTPGTPAAPRIVALTTDDQLNFTPGLVQAVPGETVTFRITNSGKATHEFMIGRLKPAFGDVEGTPEVADIVAGTTKSLTFTFKGSGPFAFACHAAGHFEHGMAGYVQLVGPGAPTVGTKADPRVVHVDMTDGLMFTPDAIAVARGETVRFVLTNSGKAVHEFQVGPADKVAADKVDGVLVVEKDELDAGSTRVVDYTFSGPGPYAFACHEPGHYEAGMKGTITLTSAG